MAEIKNNYLFAGLILAIALIAAGVTYELKPTGNYRTCSSGWVFGSDGKYSCSARVGVSYDCSSVRDSSKTKGYYCDEATRVEVKTEQVTLQPNCPVVASNCPSVRVIKYDYDGTKWLCDDQGTNCVKWSDLADHSFR